MNQNTSIITTLPDGAFLRIGGAKEYKRILLVLQDAFPTVPIDFFESIALNDPWFHPDFTLVVENDGEFQAHVQIFDRTIIYENQPVRVGGIGSVATCQEARGRGYATALMQEAMQRMRRVGMQGAILFTGIHPFYQKLGWKTLRQREFSISVDALQAEPPSYESRIMLADDYPVLHAMYSALQTQVNGTLRRNLDYWHMRPTWLLHLPVMVLHHGQIIGYFFASQYKKDQPVLTITEIGIADDSDETVKRLLHAMAQKAKELQCDTLSGFFRQHPVFCDFFQRHSFHLQENEFLYFMWCDLNESLFDSIQEKADACEFLYWQTDAI